MTMIGYYVKVKTLWDELENYQQIPRCTCGGCKWDTGSKMEKHREELGRGHRIKVPSVKLHNYVTHNIQKLSQSPSSPSSQHISGVIYPLTHYVSYDNFSMKHRRFLATPSLERESVHFAKAVKDAIWRIAMQRELQALEDNGRWNL